MGAINPITLNTLIKAKRNFSINESRCVANVNYDLEERVLTIVFQHRGTYVYKDFPLDEFTDFSSAGSQGKYFNLYIRDRYPYERVG
jgi:hypothetical protein